MLALASEPHSPSLAQWAKMRLLNLQFTTERSSHYIISSQDRIAAVACFDAATCSVSLKIFDHNLTSDLQAKLVDAVVSRATHSFKLETPGSVFALASEKSVECQLLLERGFTIAKEEIEFRGSAIDSHEAMAAVQKRFKPKTQYEVVPFIATGPKSHIQIVRKDMVELGVLDQTDFNRMLTQLDKKANALEELSVIALSNQKIIGALVAYANQNHLFGAGHYVHREVKDARVGIDLREHFYKNVRTLYGDLAPIHFVADTKKHPQTINYAKRVRSKNIHCHVKLELVL